MARLEDIVKGVAVKGILAEELVTIVDVSWIETKFINVIYRNNKGKLYEELLSRDRESELEIQESGKPWSFDADASLFRLVFDAYRIKYAHLLSPLGRVKTPSFSWKL